MKLIRSVDVTAYDLIRIEHPFFAASKTRRLLNRRDPSSIDCHGALVDICPYTAVQRVRNAELLLVHGIDDGLPFSPVITWASSRQFPQGGEWRLAREVADPALASAVGDLNRWQVTAEELTCQDPTGIGLFQADAYGLEITWQRNEERYRREREASRKPFSPRSKPTIADTRLVAD